MMSGDDYGQAFHDGETTGTAEERRRIVAFIRQQAAGGPMHERETLRIIADEIEAGLHMPTEQSGEESK